MSEILLISNKGEREKAIEEIWGGGDGKVSIQKEATKGYEVVIMDSWAKKYGGNHIALKEVRTQGIKTPDILVKGKSVIEIKRVSSLSSVDSNVRRGIKQLEARNLDRIPKLSGHCRLRKVVCLTLSLDFATVEEVVRTVGHRINRYEITYGMKCNIDWVIVRRRGYEKFLRVET